MKRNPTSYNKAINLEAWWGFFDSKDIGFRPIVCLKPDTKLVKQSDGSYQIQ